MIGNSKIINTLEKFYSVLEIEDPTEDEKMLVRNIEIDFTKSIVNEFGESQLRKVANIILASTG